jgi:hypothetical protein
MWIVLRSSTARPFTVPRLTGIPARGTALVGICPICVTTRSRSPSRLQITQLFASHKRAAFSLTISRTASILVGELLITRSTSAIAICCSNAASSSRVSRLASVFLAKGSETRWTVFGTLRCPNVLRRCVFATFPRVFPRRLIVAPEAWMGDRSNSHVCSGRGRCPLWVISRHTQCNVACPLYPQQRPRKRTSANRHACFTPESGHVQRTTSCLLWANSGLMQRSKKDYYFDQPRGE